MALPTRSNCNATPAPEELVREVKHLPSAPKILPRLKRLLRDGNTALADIVALVRIDPGLALRVMHLANSPYFFSGQRCQTVEDAVGRVGYDEIYSLVSYAAVAQVVNRPIATYGLEADQMWAESVSCALATRALAAKAGLDSSLGYTIGLFHSVGMVAIDEWFLMRGMTPLFLRETFPTEAVASERATLGYTHAEAGAALLALWEFPDEIFAPVCFQYASESAPVHADLTAVLYAAKWVRAAVLAPVPGTYPPLPALMRLKVLGLNSAVLTTVVGTVARELESVRGLLEDSGEPAVDRHYFPGQVWRG